MNTKMNVASALLLIFGAWILLEGLMALLWTEGYLDMWIGMMNEGYRPPDVSGINALGQNLLAFMTYVIHGYGFTSLFGGLLFCAMSLIPFRKGEKWAWYTVLVVGGIMSCGMLLGSYVGMTGNLPITAAFAIIWLVALALPAKEILS